ncbi:MAG: thiamine ABC transporter substrate-binding protein [Candidatus Heimdallarchaeaceae archaeon]
MKRVALILLLISLIIFPSQASSETAEINADDYSLVIYTYESLLADPGYDFISAYASYSGIPTSEIRIVYMEDANSVLSKAILEKDDPTADVLIGLDNVMIHDAKEEGILQIYDSPTLVNISETLVTNLDPEKYLLPYDYGIIALWYDLNRINTSTNPELEYLTLDDILEYDLDKQLIVEDPTLSSPGLGFLLWTIAIYGDPEINFEGVLGQNWRDWWSEAKSDLRIASSWGDAFSIYYTPEEDRPMMVSYGTSPAYDVCHPDYGVGEGNPPPSAAVVSHENPTALQIIMKNAWLQIEGIGLVNNAPHTVEAKKFIDWFLDQELQDNIPLNNWMYPANLHANIPTCFADNSISPDSMTQLLNDILTPDMIEDNLNDWLKDWEAEVASFSSLTIVLISLLSGTVAYTLIRRRKNK